MLVDPSPAALVPPGVFVMERDREPAHERVLEPSVALAVVGPSENLDHGVTAKAV
jgi:hypothetical protein